MDSTVTATAEALPRFGLVSWVVIVLYVIFTTWLGARLSGKQSTIKEFFLGGRKLPWYAVSGSIIATELSAMTLVGVPAFLWADTGNMTYASLAIGGLLARLLVAWAFIPKFYEREIYSPYDYIGNQLGNRANSVTSALFMLGGMLGQGTRVLLTAIVLQVVTGINIYWSIWIVGGIAIVWTLLGGITTVIWTDVIQFVIFTFSAIFMLGMVIYEFDLAPGMDFKTLIDYAVEANKFKMIELNFDIRENYNLSSAIIATTIGGLAAYGTDQMMAQRMFCCRNLSEARKAVVTSWVSQFLMLLCLLTGVALWAYYKKSGIEGVPNVEEAAQIAENPNRLIPVFVKFRVPAVVGGIIVAGIFAAAISSLDSILAALAQQSLAAVHRRRASTGAVAGDAEDIRLSRFFIVGWGIVLCGMATAFQAALEGKGLLIELALSVVGLTQGAILGAFFLAFFPSLRRSARGLEWAAALSVLTVFSLTQHPGKAATDSTEQTGLFLRLGEGLGGFHSPDILGSFVAWPFWVLVAASVVILGTAAVFRMGQDRRVLLKIAPFLALCFFIQLFQYRHESGHYAYLSTGWPWYAPIGMVIMIAAALLLCDKPSRGEGAVEPEPVPAA